LERFYVFRPSRDILRTPTDFGIPYDQCFIDVEKGVRLCAWHVKPDDPVGSIVYFHGNSGNLGVLNEILAMLFKSGLQVLAVDYRGYGWSTGVPSEQGFYQDARASAEYFNANFRDRKLGLVYWGRSLGGCAASYAAQEIPPDGLLLETAFPSKASLLKHYPRLKPLSPFSRYRFNTVEHLEGHQFPVLLLHGDKDRTVPLSQGQALYAAIAQPKEFWCVRGGGHVDIHMVDTKRYLHKVVEFVKSVKPALIH
jgi:fermentation-respiration switch protein FrsA (DUF1100 family)